MQNKDTRRIIRPKVLLISWLAEISILMVGTAVLAMLISQKVISERSSGYGIVLVVLLASLLGTIMMLLGNENRKILGAGAITVLIWLSLLAFNALFLQGEYEGVAAMLCLIFGGSFTAVLLRIDKRKRCKYLR